MILETLLVIALLKELFEILLVIWGISMLVRLIQRLNEWRVDKSRKLRDLLDEIGDELTKQRKELRREMKKARGKQRAELLDKLEKLDKALDILKKLPAEKLDKLPVEKLDKLLDAVLGRLQAEVNRRR